MSFGEVSFEPHLSFQVREDTLDLQPETGEGAFPVVVGGGSFAGRGEQQHLYALHPLVEDAAPEALLGDTVSSESTWSSIGSYSCSFAGTSV
jgi:hypothetical protein